MSKHWTTRYIGLPYLAGGRERDGVDCWGLLRLIYRDERNVILAELPGIVPIDDGLISRESLAECQRGWIEQDIPTEWCAVGMSRRETIHHVGIWTGADGGKIIHCYHGTPVVSDTSKTLLLKGFHIKKFYVWPT